MTAKEYLAMAAAADDFEEDYWAAVDADRMEESAYWDLQEEAAMAEFAAAEVPYFRRAA